MISYKIWDCPSKNRCGVHHGDLLICLSRHLKRLNCGDLRNISRIRDRLRGERHTVGGKRLSNSMSNVITCPDREPTWNKYSPKHLYIWSRSAGWRDPNELTKNVPNTYTRNGMSLRTPRTEAPSPSPVFFFGGNLVLMIQFAIIKSPRSMNATALIMPVSRPSSVISRDVLTLHPTESRKSARIGYSEGPDRLHLQGSSLEAGGKGES